MTLVSRALLEAMQEMEMSFVEPPTSLEQLIPAGKTWKTGITAIPERLIEQHNENHPDYALQTNRIYGIQYEGIYWVLHKEKEFRFILESHLYNRGLGAGFRPYKRNDYSGNFFLERVKERINNHIIRLSEEKI